MRNDMVGPLRFERRTLRLSAVRSTRLSYGPYLVCVVARETTFPKYIYLIFKCFALMSPLFEKMIFESIYHRQIFIRIIPCVFCCIGSVRQNRNCAIRLNLT